MRTAGSERGTPGEGAATPPRRTDSSARVAWLVAALGVAVAIAAWAMPSAAPKQEALYNGHRFTGDEPDSVRLALAEKKIAAQADEQGRIFVLADQVDKAMGVLKDAGLGPRTIGDLRRMNRESGSPLESQADRQRRDLDYAAENLEALLKARSDLSKAVVLLTVTPRRELGGSPLISAVLNLNGPNDGPLASDTVEAVRGLAVSIIPGLDSKNLKIYDGKRLYPVGGAEGNRELTLQLRADRLGYEVSQKIAGFGEGLVATVEFAAGPAPKGPNRMSINAPIRDDATEKAAVDPTAARVSVLAPAGTDVTALRVKLESTIRDAIAPYRLESLAVETPLSRGPASRRAPMPIAVPGEAEIETADRPEGVAIGKQFRWNDPLPLVVIGCGLGGVCLGVILVLSRGRAAGERGQAIVPAGSSRRRVDPPQFAGRPNESQAERSREFARMEPDSAAGVLRRWSEQGGGPHE